MKKRATGRLLLGSRPLTIEDVIAVSRDGVRAELAPAAVAAESPNFHTWSVLMPAAEPSLTSTVPVIALIVHPGEQLTGVKLPCAAVTAVGAAPAATRT